MNEVAQALETMAQAMQLMARALGSGGAAPVRAAVPGRSLGDWLDLHDQTIQQNVSYAANTIRNRRATIRYVRRLWGDRPIASLRPLDVAAGLKTLGPERSHKARKVLHELRDAYTQAILNGWCDVNPAAPVKAPRHRVKRARLAFETWLSMCELAQCGPQRWVESMLLLALVTGQRRADLAKMTFDDVVETEQGAALRVEQQKQAGKGYGARVEIPLALRMDAIGLSVGDVIEHCRHSAKPGPTLLRKHGGGPIEHSSLSARFHEHIVVVLGEGAHKTFEWPSLHEVRSLSARLYHEQGVDVQTLLGHKHAEMTDLYKDDRGLSRDVYKRVALPAPRADAIT